LHAGSGVDLTPRTGAAASSVGAPQLTAAAAYETVHKVAASAVEGASL
jgi:hypothetical protein